jgi:hypothetical protein
MHQDPIIFENDNSNPDGELVLLGTHMRDVFLRSFSQSGVYEPKPFQAADDTSYAAHETLDHPVQIGAENGGMFRDDMRIQSWARRYSRVNPVRVEGDPELRGLNATQIRAIAMMVSERATLVHGVRTIPFCFGRLIERPSFSVAPWDWKEQNYHRGSPAVEGGSRSNILHRALLRINDTTGRFRSLRTRPRLYVYKYGA